MRIGMIMVAAAWMIGASVAVASETTPTVELRGLRVSGSVSWVAVRHAIARDAWPALVACVTASPQTTQGYTNVTLRQTPSGCEVTVDGPPVRRDATVRACIERAVRQIVVPPPEGSETSVLIQFDLRVRNVRD